ncbi:MAG: hypothetical protein LBF65_02990 [Holosporales bacterium]|nr:hypothetical protein [Holosporales bacterium]
MTNEGRDTIQITPANINWFLLVEAIELGIRFLREGQITAAPNLIQMGDTALTNRWGPEAEWIIQEAIHDANTYWRIFQIQGYISDMQEAIRGARETTTEAEGQSPTPALQSTTPHPTRPGKRVVRAESPEVYDWFADQPATENLMIATDPIFFGIGGFQRKLNMPTVEKTEVICRWTTSYLQSIPLSQTLEDMLQVSKAGVRWTVIPPSQYTDPIKSWCVSATEKWVPGDKLVSTGTKEEDAGIPYTTSRFPFFIQNLLEGSASPFPSQIRVIGQANPEIRSIPKRNLPWGLPRFTAKCIREWDGPELREGSFGTISTARGKGIRWVLLLRQYLARIDAGQSEGMGDSQLSLVVGSEVLHHPPIPPSQCISLSEDLPVWEAALEDLRGREEKVTLWFSATKGTEDSLPTQFALALTGKKARGQINFLVSLFRSHNVPFKLIDNDTMLIPRGTNFGLKDHELYIKAIDEKTELLWMWPPGWDFTSGDHMDWVTAVKGV